MGTYSEKNVVQALIVLMNVIAGDLSLTSVRPSVRLFLGLDLQAGGPGWRVVFGRRDSLTANMTLAEEDLPSALYSGSQLVSNFESKGFNLRQTIALSGKDLITWLLANNLEESMELQQLVSFVHDVYHHHHHHYPLLLLLLLHGRLQKTDTHMTYTQADTQSVLRVVYPLHQVFMAELQMITA
jgi:hypothetical protein